MKPHVAMLLCGLLVVLVMSIVYYPSVEQMKAGIVKTMQSRIPSDLSVGQQ